MNSDDGFPIHPPFQAPPPPPPRVAPPQTAPPQTPLAPGAPTVPRFPRGVLGQSRVKRLFQLRSPVYDFICGDLHDTFTLDGGVSFIGASRTLFGTAIDRLSPYAITNMDVPFTLPAPRAMEITSIRVRFRAYVTPGLWAWFSDTAMVTLMCQDKLFFRSLLSLGAPERNGWLFDLSAAPVYLQCDEPFQVTLSDAGLKHPPCETWNDDSISGRVSLHGVIARPWV